ncbi:hypothetical protein VCHENC02_3281B, partial [Vibrio harveyi]
KIATIVKNSLPFYTGGLQ